ncbi:MAG: hypothetical protein QGH51_09705 [Planctomycetota bacterium]|jgi:hypothetical protein|nr:hypothetical protein [Planctomycetota bacterium]MDP6942285.1 hypothetical protein [Planctomycetota bacterium]
MKLLSLISVLLLSTLAVAQEKTKGDAFEVFENARLEAAETGRNLFVHLGAPW